MSMRHVLGTVFFALVLAPRRIRSEWQRLDPGLRTVLLWLAAVAALMLPFLLLGGCQARPAAHIDLPTTAALRAPLAAAKTHADRSVAIGVQEQALAKVANTQGIAAGSAEAGQLSSFIAADNIEKVGVQNQLTAALYRAGEMDRLQAAKQAQIDALEKDDAAKTATVASQAVEITKVKHSRRIWSVLFGLSLVADFFAGHLIERYLRGAVEFFWRVIGSTYHLAAGALKAMFPLYTFWLPA